MRAVDVRIGHHDDLVVAELREVELVANPDPDGGDQVADPLVLQHRIEAGLLDVEDLAPERQDRLELPVPALLRGAAGRVTLDDEEFAEGGVPRVAVGELAR